MDEFKFCPFRKFLPRALGLDFNLEEHEKQKLKEENELDVIVSIDEPDTKNKLLLNENVKETKEEESKNNKKVELINFKRFCNIMKMFNLNYPVDIKIKCKFIYLFYLVYFKLFDTDGDGKINRNDFKTFLSEIFKDDLKEVKEEQMELKKKENEYIEKNNQNENEDPEKKEKEKDIPKTPSNFIDFNELINIVFGEIVFNEKRNYIDYDEFSRVLWTTTIDRKCVIDFEQFYLYNINSIKHNFIKFKINEKV